MSSTPAVKTLPLPKPDTEMYQAVLEAGFAKYPERKRNYDIYRASQRGIKLDYLPVKLDIENVSRCNFRCTMCQVSGWKGGKRAEDMSFDDYRRLLEEQHGVVEIKLQGMGEPTMGKCYYEMIRFARERHIWVRTVTNASLLHHKDNYKKLIDSDANEIQISIDGARKESYEKIRRGGNFELTKANCKLINTYARSVGKLRTKMWTVVQRDNYDDLREFPKLAAELGFDRMVLSLELTDWGQEHWKKANDEVYRGDNFSYELAEEIMQMGESLGVTVRFWFIAKKYDYTDPAKLCAWPFERAYVSSDMRIVPCCKIATPEVYDLGDATKFTEVWNSEKFEAFRRAQITGKLPAVCRSCYVSHEA